jgi:hypothetical protein
MRYVLYAASSGGKPQTRTAHHTQLRTAAASLADDMNFLHMNFLHINFLLIKQQRLNMRESEQVRSPNPFMQSCRSFDTLYTCFDVFHTMSLAAQSSYT